MFKDREDAGKKLAGEMAFYRWVNPLILALPRGGVVIARYLWECLGGEIDLYITRKIGAPAQPELAVGAVAGDGSMVLDEDLISRLNISRDYLDREVQKEVKEIQRRMIAYRGDRPLPRYEGRQIILVDDGVATGSTVLSAIRGLQENRPDELVLAVPVGPPDTLKRLANEVDRVFYLEAPPGFAAVGQFYLNFGQVEDEEVIRILGEVWGD